MQYMSKLVICKAALTSHIILQDIIYKTPSGNTIEPPLMGSPSRRRSVSIKCQRNSSLQSASARGTIAFSRTASYAISCFSKCFTLQNTSTIFPQTFFVCIGGINLVYKRKHKPIRDKYQTQDQDQLKFRSL